MMHLKDLRLREITRAEYWEIKQQLGIKIRSRRERGSKLGFAEIKKPLVYRSFRELLNKFVKTPGAQEVLFLTPGMKKQRRSLSGLTDDEIKRLLENISPNTAIYTVFHKRIPNPYIRNDLCFEFWEREVVSMRVKLAGEQTERYTWIGSNGGYRQINGIYVPKPI